MKIQINKNILFNALKINCSLIDSSSFNPIADAVLIIASSQNIKIINTNNYLSCLVEIKENFTCEQSGEVLIKAKILFNVVSKLSNQTIDIEVVDNSVIRITQSKFISDINLLDKSLFSVPNFNHDSWTKIEIPQSIIKLITTKLIPCATTNENKNIACNNILIDSSRIHGIIEAIGTDGNHLSYIKTNHQTQPFKIIVNIQILKQISEFLNNTNTVLYLNNKNIVLQSNNATFLIRTTEGEYPNLTMQLNQSLPYKIITNLNQLLNAIEKATILLTTEKKPTIHLSIIQNTLKISARSTEYGSTFEEITIDNINNLPQTNFTFNAKYLITLLKNIESESVIIEFSSSNKPVFIKQDNSQDYTSLILPIVGF